MSYWKERSTKKYLYTEKQVNKYYKELEQAYNQAKRDILGEINKFYGRYAKETGLSYTDAMVKLNREELQGIEQYIKSVNELLSSGIGEDKVITQSIKARMTRLDGLVTEIDARLQLLYYQIEADSEELYKEVYQESYSRGQWNLDCYRGYHDSMKSFIGINDTAIEKLIKYPFSGKDYSTRLWGQQSYFVESLREDITTMLIQGNHPRTLSNSLAKRFKTKKYEAYRLLHTEHAFIVEQANKQLYEDEDVQWYEYIATLDSRTCDICGEHDGKHYKVAEMISGKNASPMHCFCRCTTAPYYGNEDIFIRLAKDNAGRYIEVDSHMSYQDWKKKFINK